MNRRFCFLLILAGFLGCQNSQEAEAPDRVPQWAKEVVWYQIFPERFHNGDPSNDPTTREMKGSWPDFPPSEDWQVHPWTSDWYKLQPWENVTGRGFYWESGHRRYGGDLQGVLDKLDYLQELGVTGIYFNPLFESPSLHKYDASLYRHIDNNFGPEPEKDRALWEQEDPADPATWQWTAADKLFLKLLDECHKRGIRVIIDGVWNHVGSTFWAFQDLVENQQNSKYKDWFTVKAWDDPATSDTSEFDYEGWFGVRTLPEIRENENGFVPAFQEHVRNILKRWMDPNGDGDPSDGIDGWRLDVSEMVELKFWHKFRGWVKEINPDAYITGELWWEDWPKNKMFNAAPWLDGRAYDAVMNYRFAAAVKQFVIDQKTQISAQTFADKMRQIRADYHSENYHVLQNLMASHDVDRVNSQVVNPDRWYDHDAKPEPQNNYDVRKPNAEEVQKHKLIVGIQMTMPGAPMVYYGDEAGMWGGDDPDCRKPMVWPEFEYDDETTHPQGKQRPRDTVEFNQDLFDWYKKLIAIRKSDRVFSVGELAFFKIDNERKIVGYKRTLAGEERFVIINNNDAQSIEIDAAEGTTAFEDLISGETFSVESGKCVITVPALQLAVLRPSSR